ncbi:MAG: hypothetical protein WEC39_01245 [Patescibacteria group bacterium]
MIAVYNWYGKNTRYYPPRVENFCRACRIIFVWAPGLWIGQKVMDLWFWLVKLGQRPVTKRLQVWMVAGFLFWAIVLWLQPLLIAFLTALALVLFWIIILLNRFWSPIEAVLRFLWYLLLFVVVGVILIALVVWIVNNWAEFLQLIVLGLKIFGVLLIGFAIVVLLFFGIRGIKDWLVDWWQRRRSRRTFRPSRPPRYVLRNIGGTISLGWHWLVVLKRKTICPMVQFTKDGYVKFDFSGTA